MPGNRLLAQKKVFTKETIQKVAKEIFFQKGFANTTIEEICKAAGIGKGSIYFYFKTKDDLFLSLMFPILGKINESCKKMERNLDNHRYKSCEEIVRAFYEHFMGIYKFDPKGIKIIQAMQHEDLFLSMGEEIREKFRTQESIVLTISRNIISKATDLGLFPALNPFQVIDCFWGSFIGIVQLEESKLRATGKTHLKPTVEMAFSLFAGGANSIQKNGHLKEFPSREGVRSTH